MSVELIKVSDLEPIKTLKLEDRIGLLKSEMESRDKMMATILQNCTQITVPAEQLVARDSAVKLKEWLQGAEDNMSAINSIVMPLQRKARRLTDEACAPVQELLTRLENMLTGFRKAEEARVAREEQERQRKIKAAAAETERLEKEARDRAAKIEADRQEAERLQREADELKEKAKTPKQVKEAEKVQQQATKAANVVGEEELEAAAAAELEAYEAGERQRQVILSKPVEVSHAKGLVGGRRKKWEVDTSDPEALHKVYAHNRSLVRLTPNAAAILSTCFPEMPVPGLKLWWEDKTDIRK